MARTAVHEEEDDAFGLRWMMRRLRREGIRASSCWSPAGKQCAQRERAESRPGGVKKVATVDVHRFTISLIADQ